MKNLRPHVLLVEDSPLASAAAIAVLAKLGCLVDLAEEGMEALRLVKQKYYDMIFMDLRLTDVDGMLITEKIKKIEGAKQIPVVALTVHDDESLKERCFKIGMMGFIKKPLQIEKARYFLQKYLPTFEDPSV